MKSKLLLIGLISTISFPLILVSCQNEVKPEEPKPKPPVEPPIIFPPSDITEFANGGDIDLGIENKATLKVDKFLSVVKQLNFNKYSNISNLTNKGLTTSLQANPAFNLLNLTILEGSSQASQKLLLSLDGTYEGHKITNEQITISNFYKFTSSNEVKVSSIPEINKLNFITDLKTINDVSSFTIQDFFKYNAKPISVSFSTNFNVSNWDLKEIVDNGFISEMKFNSASFDKKVPWVISLSFVEKKYDGTKWVIDSTQAKKLTGYKVGFDVEGSAIQVLAETVTINNNVDKNIYASTIFLNSQRKLATWETFIQINQEISNKYFGAVNNIGIEGLNLSPNDINGILAGNFKLSYSSDTSSAKYSASTSSKQIANFKKSSELFSPENLALIENRIFISPGGIFEANIIQDLNKVENSSKLKNLSVGETIEIGQSEFTSSFGIPQLKPNILLFKNYWIDNPTDGPSDQSLGDLHFLSEKGVKFHLLGEKNDLISRLSYKRNGLFNNFLIKTLNIAPKQNNISIKITKENSYKFKIYYDLHLELDYYEGIQSITSYSEIQIDSKDIV